jgi:hypothetical protein
MAALGQRCTIGDARLPPAAAGPSAAGERRQASAGSGAVQQREVVFVHNPLKGNSRPALCCVWDGRQACCGLVGADGGACLPPSWTG